MDGEGPALRMTPSEGHAVVGRLYLENLALRDMIAMLTAENKQLKEKLAEKESKV